MESLGIQWKVTWFAMRKREAVAVYHEVGSHFLKSNLLRFDTPERRYPNDPALTSTHSQFDLGLPS